MKHRDTCRYAWLHGAAPSAQNITKPASNGRPLRARQLRQGRSARRPTLNGKRILKMENLSQRTESNLIRMIWRLEMNIVFSSAVCFFALVVSVEAEPGQKMEPELLSRTTQDSDLSLTLKLPAKVRGGSSLPLTVLVHNQSKDKLAIVEESLSNPMELRIVDSEGREVPFTRYGKKYYRTDVFHGSAGRRRLLPGASMMEVVELQRVFDLSLEGTYTLSFTSLPQRVRVPLQPPPLPQPGTAALPGARARRRPRPVRYRSLVARPKPKARPPLPPGQRGQPPSIDRPPAARPWRAAGLH